MSNRMLVSLVTGVTAAVAGGWLPMAAVSQQRGQRPVVTAAETVRPPKRPAPLSDSARAKVLAGALAGQKWSVISKNRFSLSPNHPYVTLRGRLNFKKSKLILTGQDEVAYLDGSVDVVINAAKGQRFLAECAVSCDKVTDDGKCSGSGEVLGVQLSLAPPRGFTVEDAKPGTRKQEFSAEPGGQHLLPVLEAFQSGENRYGISAGGPWWFHSCTITPL